MSRINEITNKLEESNNIEVEKGTINSYKSSKNNTINYHENYNEPINIRNDQTDTVKSNRNLKETNDDEKKSQNFNKYIEDRLQAHNYNSNSTTGKNSASFKSGTTGKDKQNPYQNQINQLQIEIDAMKHLEKKYIELANRFERVNNQLESLKVEKEISDKENRFQAEINKKQLFTLQNDIDNLNLALHEK